MQMLMLRQGRVPTGARGPLQGAGTSLFRKAAATRTTRRAWQHIHRGILFSFSLVARLLRESRLVRGGRVTCPAVLHGIYGFERPPRPILTEKTRQLSWSCVDLLCSEKVRDNARSESY